MSLQEMRDDTYMHTLHDAYIHTYTHTYIHTQLYAMSLQEMRDDLEMDIREARRIVLYRR
jgi:hypothetical protein